MNKKQILKMLLLLKKRGGTGGSINNFYRTDRSEFDNTQEEVETELQKLLEIRCIDHNHKPTTKLDEYIERIQKEVDKEEELENIIIGKTRHEAKLVSWKVKAFKPLFILAVVGGINGVYNIMKPDNNIKKSDLSQYIKKTDLDKYLTKKEFDKDLIYALDLIYSDSTLLNK